MHYALILPSSQTVKMNTCNPEFQLEAVDSSNSFCMDKAMYKCTVKSITKWPLHCILLWPVDVTGGVLNSCKGLLLLCDDCLISCTKGTCRL